MDNVKLESAGAAADEDERKAKRKRKASKSQSAQFESHPMPGPRPAAQRRAASVQHPIPPLLHASAIIDFVTSELPASGFCVDRPKRRRTSCSVSACDWYVLLDWKCANKCVIEWWLGRASGSVSVF